MEKVILGTFPTHAQVEQLVRDLNEGYFIPGSDISYVHRDRGGADAVNRETHTPADGAATGAVVGGSVGALAGLAAVAGVIPVVGPILVAGPFVTMLGLGTGVVGTTVAGAVTGAVAGGLVGALVNLGASESEAQAYEERVRAGDTLVVVHAADAERLAEVFTAHGATSVNTYTPVTRAM